MCDREGIPVAWAADGANRHDQTLLEPTLAAAERRCLLADVENLHLDRGYDGDPVLRTCHSYGISDIARAQTAPRHSTARAQNHAAGHALDR